MENLPDIFRRLKEVDLYTFEACGDCPRNITGNPLAGIDPHELVDTRPIVAKLNEKLLLNREFSNLPRKYKISVSSSVYNPAHAQINDLSFTPAVKKLDGKETVGFHVWVGEAFPTGRIWLSSWIFSSVPNRLSMWRSA